MMALAHRADDCTVQLLLTRVDPVTAELLGVQPRINRLRT
jgi:hypothetical protein